MMTRLSYQWVLLVLPVLFTGPLSVRADEAGTYVVKARRVYTMSPDGPWMHEPGMLLVKDGRIAAVGEQIEIPPFVDVVDLSDSVIIPGLVAADTSLVQYHRGEESVGPQYAAVDAFDPYANYARFLAGGVTSVYLNPGRHRLVTGVGGVVKLGTEPDDAVVQSSVDLVLNLGEAAFNPPPDEHWLVPPSSDLQIEPGDVQRPTSRLGQFLQLRESFADAQDYAEARSGPEADRPAFDPRLEALADMMRRKITLRVRADRATDIEQAIDFCRAQRHAFILAGGLESYRLAKRLADADVPIVYSVPMNPMARGGDLGRNPDQLEDVLTIPEPLHDLPIAIAVGPGSSDADLMLHAAAAVRCGLSEKKALEGVTSTAARILGVDQRVGSLRVGRDADFLVLNGPPLRSTTHVRRAYVNGELRFDASAHAPDALIVRAGKIWTGERWVRDGAVLIEEGRIVAAGETVPGPAYARTINAGDSAVVTPGFIDARGHLGFEGDRGNAGADVSIAKALFKAGPEFHRVSRAGVTTVLTSTYRPGRRASRVSAIHTAGNHRKDLIVKETAGLIFSLRGQEPKAAAEALKGALKAGKKYDDAWKKYEKALAEFKKKGPKKAEDAAKKEEKEKKKEKDDVVVEKPKDDPVTGTWEGEISGRPLPEPQQFKAKLKLDGSKVEGTIETIFGGGAEVGVSGTFEGSHLSLEIETESPFGNPKIEADIDRADHITGTLEFGGRFSFDLEANRTEKAVPKITVKRRRKKKKDDGAPEAPKKNEALEPYRDLFAGRIAMVIDVGSRRVIDAILPVFNEKGMKVPFVLLNAEDARKLKDKLVAAKVGVILPTTPVQRIDRKPYLQSADLSRAGIPLAFQSNAEDAARRLPDRAAYDVYRGLDATAALKALTGDAARLLRCDDQVGVLKPGRRGDVLVFDGPPLEPGTRLQRVIIDGKEIHP